MSRLTKPSTGGAGLASTDRHADASQTRLEPAGAASERKAVEVLPPALSGLCESRCAAEKHSVAFPQVPLVCCGQPKRSMSMVKGMISLMHQQPYEMRGSL